MGLAIGITRFEHDAAAFRRAAGRSRDVAASRRMLALALVLEGASRTDAATAAGMDRQTLRDWVHRYNAHGLEGLFDRQGAVGPKPFLSPAQEAEVAAWVRQGPSLAEHGVVRWRRADLARADLARADLARAVEARFGVVFAERSMSDVLRRLGFRRLGFRRLGFRRLVARPQHPGHDPQAQASFSTGSRPV